MVMILCALLPFCKSWFWPYNYCSNLSEMCEVLKEECIFTNCVIKVFIHRKDSDCSCSFPQILLVYSYTQVEGSYDDDDEALIAQFQEMMHKIDISC